MKISQAVYSKEEEKANAITHALGFLFSLISIPFLLYFGYRNSTMVGVVGIWIYGFSLLLSMACSTIYHYEMDPIRKVLLKKFDHISIYFLIAGTYTVLILNMMFFTEALYYLVGLWSMALVGIWFKWYYVQRFKFLSTLIYVLMGYLLLLDPWMFFRSLSRPADLMLITGGVFYTVGAGFYLWKSRKWTHTIWHILVLLGAGFHFAAFLHELM